MQLLKLGVKRSIELSRLTQLKNILSPYSKFYIFGYNSQKFDLKVLMALLMHELESRELIRGVKVLKKGSAYFSLVFDDIHFKDLMGKV